ncbi:MAG: MBL fold metallo-hydrolase [Opitutus sp.]
MNIFRPLPLALASSLLSSAAVGQINTVQTIAPGVYFHEGDMRRGHCNNGWVVCDDFVFVIDANFPSGANVVMPKIKESSDKPVRFVFDTHHHGDHAYGNKVWADGGATLVANTGVLEEMKSVETARFGGAPGRWEQAAKGRPDVAATELKPPVLLFPKELFFDDGKHRIELHWFGVAHTRGDGFAWLPKEKILFTGDACVNGPHNYLADANVGDWIKTLEAVKQLGAKIVCPGHGPIGGPEIIIDQQAYFIALVQQIKNLKDAGKTPAEVKAALPQVVLELKKTPNIARFVPTTLDGHAERVYRELGGEPFPR